ncbi:hypothetical protein [Mariniplasma anaerobium]|uniref:Uncharacterized protein n=1 Tax=Mariniplasma anaerobium TaxID=2735436 RepID=A0A7U9TI57_9MOLU|nr:hypothetical protein [Mariniplasma anaerobium]BCR36148.1 hypothetical protein MPAN_010410 [Mariniplasma anaerobium]
MITIKELSEIIDIAQDTVYDQNLYYDKLHQTLIVQIDDYAMDDYEDNNDDLLLIRVEPFAKDMFLEFFETIANPNVRDMFVEQFHGSKKYRKVKDLLPRYHLLESFYKFKDQYQLGITKMWCVENNIDYIDKDGKEVIIEAGKRE